MLSTTNASRTNAPKVVAMRDRIGLEAFIVIWHENKAESHHSHKIIPNSSPSIGPTFAGINFNNWNGARKYHSGLMPIGAGPNGSASGPRVQGEDGVSRIRR